MIVAGEASGDAHAAKLVRELRAQTGIDFEFFGAASHHLRAEGVEEIVNADELSVVGLLEIGKVLPMFWRAFRKLRDAAVSRRADAVILVDFPEFNLKLARSLKRRGIKVIYYISPQIWAWRQYRIGAIKKYVDLLLTILPFEKDWYLKNGFSKVEYVGNPTISEVAARSTREEFCSKYGLNPKRPVIALLPGSRHKEIARILPLMLQTAEDMTDREPALQFVIALANLRRETEVAAAFSKSGVVRDALSIVTAHGETFDALNASDAAAVTSGTATLETAVIGTPLAIVYKTSPLNYRIFRPMISVEHFGLINLIADERIATELLQDDLTTDSLGTELFRLLDPEVNASFRRRLAEATEKLGHGGASARAASAILLFLSGADENSRNGT
ncbi:MAG: lipid-A-disaccharide synthase [Acidobacteria bacterium]|nr:lipid-A-disaccharide synthase [Acidobacteriota bacterium]